MSERMRRWEMDRIGRDRLVLRDAPVPAPGPGEVLVKVAAVALNYRDLLVVDSGMGMALDYPVTPGSDLAGTVAAVGEGVRRLAVGDRVISTFAPGWIDGLPPGDGRNPSAAALGGILPGVLSSHVVFPADWFVRSPRSLDDARASTLTCAGLTAWFALVETGRLGAGETVVIEGTGGVGLFGLQIARMRGARAIVVSGHAGKLDRARALGADAVVDRTAEDWVAAVHRLTDGRGADHVLELVGGAHLGRAVQAAAVGGRVYQIGVMEGFEVSAPAGPLMLKAVTIHGIVVGHRRALEDLVAAVDLDGLEPVIDGRFPLSALPAALDRLAGGPFGKVVVDVD